MRHILLLTLFCFLSCSSGNGQDQNADVRQPAVAGQFYPADAAQLKKAVNECLTPAVQEKNAGEIIGLIAPHAGYIYSAPVAAFSYKQLAGKKYRTVFVIGRSHHDRFSYAAVWPAGAFQTPLGRVSVNQKLVDQLLKSSPLFKADREPHLPEHSIEVQLPFLQVLLDSFTLVPLVLGFDDPATAAQVAKFVAAAAQGQNALIVASTDLSHYPAYSDANRIDRATLESWKTLDPAQICATERRLMNEGVTEEHCTMCAASAVLVTILAAKELGATQLKVLKYANSGDAVGDHDRVVGYGAAMITK